VAGDAEQLRAGIVGRPMPANRSAAPQDVRHHRDDLTLLTVVGQP
jgi:hypothetical protein